MQTMDTISFDKEQKETSKPVDRPSYHAIVTMTIKPCYAAAQCTKALTHRMRTKWRVKRDGSKPNYEPKSLRARLLGHWHISLFCLNLLFFRILFILMNTLNLRHPQVMV